MKRFYILPTLLEAIDFSLIEYIQTPRMKYKSRRQKQMKVKVAIISPRSLIQNILNAGKTFPSLTMIPYTYQHIEGAKKSTLIIYDFHECRDDHRSLERIRECPFHHFLRPEYPEPVLLPDHRLYHLLYRNVLHRQFLCHHRDPGHRLYRDRLRDGYPFPDHCRNGHLRCYIRR